MRTLLGISAQPLMDRKICVLRLGRHDRSSEGAPGHAGGRAGERRGPADGVCARVTPSRHIFRLSSGLSYRLSSRLSSS